MGTIMTRGTEQQSRLGQLNGQSREQMKHSETGIHVDLWLRENPPYCVRDVQEETYEKLQPLQENGIIASFSCYLWTNIETSPRKTSTEHAAICCEKIAEFEDWANGHGYTLRPGFQTREISAMLTDETREEFVPPILCLAVYKDNTLEAVFPHTDGECVRTVADGVEHLEAETDNHLVLFGGPKA